VYVRHPIGIEAEGVEVPAVVEAADPHAEVQSATKTTVAIFRTDAT